MTHTLMKYDFNQILFMFFLFCNIGWIQESLIESIYHKKWVNRGFLKGPYIPIYGFGGLLLMACCLPFRENGFLVYLSALISCTILEYFVGWLMERFFHKQFWDYSMMNFTYKNRISLISSMFWGILGLFMTYVLYDIVDAVVVALPLEFVGIYDIILLIAVGIDTAVSVSLQLQFREKLKKLSKEKAAALIKQKFIKLGGAVMMRRQKITNYISQLRFSLSVNINEEKEDEQNGETEESTDI